MDDGARCTVHKRRGVSVGSIAGECVSAIPFMGCIRAKEGRQRISDDIAVAVSRTVE